MIITSFFHCVNKLSSVGTYALTAEQNNSLGFSGLLPVSEADNRPFVEISMFHQLHCLNFIRHLVYQPRKWAVYYTVDEKIQKEVHVDHCVDYLRQVRFFLIPTFQSDLGTFLRQILTLQHR